MYVWHFVNCMCLFLAFTKFVFLLLFILFIFYFLFFCCPHLSMIQHWFIIVLHIRFCAILFFLFRCVFLFCFFMNQSETLYIVETCPLVKLMILVVMLSLECVKFTFCVSLLFQSYPNVAI